ncbi:MAG: prepilin-type N-terminal cleavage/methylation domain-containing protein [Sandaracinaceae bacterium]|nr:prepilin-type N-terminal cleavage/methylation domain-containing protein [Sandaracinaceae bacterium]
MKWLSFQRVQTGKSEQPMISAKAIACHSLHRSRAFITHRRAGLTLIEITVVILILAMVATSVSYGLGALFQSELRSACMRLAAASRFAFNRAVSHGKTIRITLDFSAHTMAIEEAHSRITLARTDDPRREAIEKEDDTGADHAAVDPWAAAKARLADTLRPSFGHSPFRPIPGERYAPQSLGRGVMLLRLYTPHENDAREHGKGHIYFFSHGQAEHAVIWLGDGRKSIFSIEIHPLNGKVKVRSEPYEPEEFIVPGDQESASEGRER